jgi:serine O-acetyltransferase
MFNSLQRDRAVYKGVWYRRSGFWIVAVYRFGNWADSLPSILLRTPAWTLYLCLKLITGAFTSNIFLWAGRRGAQIGSGLCLVHPANVMIGRGVVIGENCQIYHEVTLGTGQVPGTPKIGNRVTIYPGARLLGGIAIGDKTMIGANCVVTKDVPPNSVVLSTPSRVIPRSLSTQARRWDEGREPLQPLSKQPPVTLE